MLYLSIYVCLLGFCTGTGFMLGLAFGIFLITAFQDTRYMIQKRSQPPEG